MNNQYAQMFKQRQAYMNQRANQYIQNHQPQHRGQIQVAQGQSLQQHAAMMRQQEQKILAQKQQQRQRRLRCRPQLSAQHRHRGRQAC